VVRGRHRGVALLARLPQRQLRAPRARRGLVRARRGSRQVALRRRQTRICKQEV
jgi:hypothetical protein